MNITVTDRDPRPHTSGMQIVSGNIRECISNKRHSTRLDKAAIVSFTILVESERAPDKIHSGLATDSITWCKLSPHCILEVDVTLTCTVPIGYCDKSTNHWMESSHPWLISSRGKLSSKSLPLASQNPISSVTNHTQLSHSHLCTLQICRKIRGLGCVTRTLVCMRFTQPSPHIFLHICITRTHSL